VKRTLKALGLCVVMVWVLVACSGGGDSDTQATNAAAPVVPPTIPPNAEPALPLNDAGVQLVARVNGAEITLPVFERSFSRSQRVSDPDDYDAAVDLVLTALIEQTLIDQQATVMGMTVSEEEIETQYQDMRAMIPDDGEWQLWLENNLFTEAEFRQSLHANLITQRVQAAVVDTNNVSITMIHARHILVPTEAEATTILARLDGGEDFGQLAAEFSQDPNTREAGGDLGWFVRTDLTVPELADFAQQLQPGQHGGPFVTTIGYHVVETLETSQRPATPEEQYNAGVLQFNHWLDLMRGNAIIERYIN